MDGETAVLGINPDKPVAGEYAGWIFIFAYHIWKVYILAENPF